MGALNGIEWKGSDCFGSLVSALSGLGLDRMDGMRGCSGLEGGIPWKVGDGLFMVMRGCAEGAALSFCFGSAADSFMDEWKNGSASFPYEFKIPFPCSEYDAVRRLMIGFRELSVFASMRERGAASLGMASSEHGSTVLEESLRLLDASSAAFSIVSRSEAERRLEGRETAADALDGFLLSCGLSRSDVREVSVREDGRRIDAGEFFAFLSSISRELSESAPLGIERVRIVLGDGVAEFSGGRWIMFRKPDCLRDMPVSELVGISSEGMSGFYRLSASARRREMRALAEAYLGFVPGSWEDAP